jgi:hypothetical protein
MRQLSTRGAHRACFGHRVHLIFFLKFKMKHVFGIKQALKKLARSKDKLCNKLFENRHLCLANIHYYRTDFRSRVNPIFCGGERVRMDKNVCVNRSSPRRFNICLLAKIEYKKKPTGRARAWIWAACCRRGRSACFATATAQRHYTPA